MLEARVRIELTNKGFADLSTLLKEKLIHPYVRRFVRNELMERRGNNQARDYYFVTENVPSSLHPPPTTA